jgi:hypothetical protein
VKYSVLGKLKDVENDYTTLFGCKPGSFSFRYLGIPIHFCKLTNGEWKIIEDRFEKKLASWLGKMLSYGDWLVLINAVLTSLPMLCYLSLRLPKEVPNRLDYFRSRFFWQSDGHKKKYRLTRWNIICEPKYQWGLGIEVV